MIGVGGDSTHFMPQLGLMKEHTAIASRNQACLYLPQALGCKQPPGQEHQHQLLLRALTQSRVCRNAVTGAGEGDREVLAGTAPAQSAPAQQQPANGGALPLPPALNAADQKRMLKAQKKSEKEKRRAEKKVCCQALS